MYACILYVGVYVCGLVFVCMYIHVRMLGLKRILILEFE